MPYDCKRCGACCLAVKCPLLVKNEDGTYSCSVYETRPTICRIDEMAKLKGIDLKDYYAMAEKACEQLRRSI